jgi:hypothetical protein
VATDLPCPYRRGAPLTIELEAGGLGTNAPAAAAVVARGRRLWLRDLARLDSETAHATVIRCVLESLLDGCAGGAATNPPAASPPAAVPGWLAVGLPRALFAVRRQDDRQQVLAEWEAGRQSTLPVFLESMRALGPCLPTRALDRARCGVLVAWIASQPDRDRAFARLLSALAGDPATMNGDWWAGLLRVEQAGAVGLDAAWDARMLRERRVVDAPGRTTRADVRRLRAALLIFPGLYGMPFSGTPYGTVEWSALIEMRDRPWLRDFCRNKGASLRLLAAGRGPALLKVADAYSAYLEAVAEGRAAWRLRRLLGAALDAEGELVSTWLTGVAAEDPLTEAAGAAPASGR